MVFHASATHPENGVVILLEPGMTWLQLDCSRAINRTSLLAHGNKPRPAGAFQR